MFIWKKRFLIALAALITAAAVTGIVTGAVAAGYSNDGAKTVVIDAGHGGVDAGVRGIETDCKESDINLYIAKYLRGYFTDAGFKVVMTRTTQGGLYGTSTKGFKARDMKKRREIIEESGADMVISVHQNYCPIPSRRGCYVFYQSGSESGKTLAASIQGSVNSMEECVSEHTELSGDYFILKCTESPSVIVECGFLSNSEDEQLLLSSDYQQSIAYAVFKGAVAYYC